MKITPAEMRPARRFVHESIKCNCGRSFKSQAHLLLHEQWKHKAREALSNNHGSGFATPPDAKPKKTPEGL